MDYSKLFNDFWNDVGRYEGYNNPSRTQDLIVRKLKDCESIADIDDFVYSARTGRETRRQIIVRFYDYLKDKKGIPVESELYERKFVNTRIEELMQIAKYLHEPRTVDEIETFICRDERTRREYLDDLERGIQFMGSNISIKKTREGRTDYYKCTIHPIFLPLNLEQVFIITKYLNELVDKNDVNAAEIRDIQERIKSQLTDYAFNKLFPDEKREENEVTNDFISGEEMVRQEGRSFPYLMKSGDPFRFKYRGKEYEGRVCHDSCGFYVRLVNGERLEADLSELGPINDSIDY